ncbi:uncharacterized protein [Salmo salar]|uniref:Uncharacterized protein n=1 Tax=Salmo salar TaxID=8030 RepID=A0A1S3MJI8_SALSA|nr:uncharacterized protein LOC106573162 [Salmo salar]|eukprot:XP_014003347.1 PREDICTED: uncharacterized protein LOC106573162 [Salmo salar]
MDEKQTVRLSLGSNGTQVKKGTATKARSEQSGLGASVGAQSSLALNPSTRRPEEAGDQSATHPQRQKCKKERCKPRKMKRGVYIMPLKQYKAYTPGSQRTCRPLLLFEVRNRHNTKPTKPTLPTKPTIRPLLIHGLSVNEYRAVYNTVVEPFASTASTLSSYSHPQGINIKQRLWLTLDRPKLEEVVHKDGRVEVLETFISVF